VTRRRVDYVGTGRGPVGCLCTSPLRSGAVCVCVCDRGTRGAEVEPRISCQVLVVALGAGFGSYLVRQKEQEKRMLHRQNRQNDRGPDEATTELGALEQGCEWTWTMVPSLPIPLRSETIDVDSIRQGRVRRVWFGGLHSASVNAPTLTHSDTSRAHSAECS